MSAGSFRKAGCQAGEKPVTGKAALPGEGLVRPYQYVVSPEDKAEQAVLSFLVFSKRHWSP